MSATLTSLRIRNLALVEDLSWEPEAGFTAITGETGAGKSVILGALTLLLGERADKTLIRTGADLCTVEAVFEGVTEKRIFELLEEHGAEPCEEGTLLVKRTLPAEGSGKHFVNGSPCTLARGNPIEIAAVVVWRVTDTANALFDVDEYQTFVDIQIETAVREIASHFAYDHAEHEEPTLRGDADQVSSLLREKLQERVSVAGVVVDETKLSHLAYAPEIASAMLRRQQAEAVPGARRFIVQGAVEMVQHALEQLSERDIVKLDDERRATMVSNLLVVLCGDRDA
ncbi:MAG TPA: SPFH domain-containing protein, partial [Terrimicrobiaceae bacterium]|nr:SPFH domain-containing protein [Terrimicrobiaceae bacterium]